MLIEADAPIGLVIALKNHGSSVNVARAACGAIAALTTSCAGRSACVASGTVEAIVEVMTTHANDEEVCRQGTEALFNLGRSTEGRQANLAAGAGYAVLSAKTVHPSLVSIWIRRYAEHLHNSCTMNA